MRTRFSQTTGLIIGFIAPFAAGCGGDWTVAPVTEVRIAAVQPALFGAGDTIEVRGPGVGRANIVLAGAELEPLSRGRDRQVLVAHDELPGCGDPLPRVAIVARFEALQDSIEVPTLGSPIEANMARAEHAIIPHAEAGCRVRVLKGGVYGVAVFRVSTSVLTASQRVQQPVRVRLLGGRPDESATHHVERADAPADGLPRHLAREPATDISWRRATSFCDLEPLTIGDELELKTPYTENVRTYRAVSTSPHYAVLVEVDSLAAYGAARLVVVEGLADRLQSEVHPFLSRAFHEWPDIDGNGQLHIVFQEGYGASYSGAYEQRVDGCAGDFVQLSHGLLDPDAGTGDGGVLSTIVHEATHWYDIGPSLTSQESLPVWTIEAVPTLTERLWLYEWRGMTMWDNHETECPAGATCTRRFLEGDRFGGGLSRVGGYSHGSYIVQYLLEQVLEVGEQPHQALGRFRERSTGHDDRQLRPIFEVLGGRGRSEAQLVGEYLLSFYADDHVEGTSRRIMQYGWNIPQNVPEYPLRAFRLSGDVPEDTLLLGRPDGTVIEINAAAGAVLQVEPARAGLALALVRAN